MTLVRGPREPMRFPDAASRNGCRSSSLEATGLLKVTVRSTIETFVTGTRTEVPVNFPASSGNTRATAVAAPVVVGMMLEPTPLPVDDEAGHLRHQQPHLQLFHSAPLVRVPTHPVSCFSCCTRPGGAGMKCRRGWWSSCQSQCQRRCAEFWRGERGSSSKSGRASKWGSACRH